jgi:hypothetical protein
MRKGVALFACTLAASLVALLAAQGGASAQSGAAVQRTLYVTAVDERGAYVTDLSVADLIVREAGADRALVRVEPSRTRLKVGVVVEELLVPDDEVRKGLAGFIDRVREQGEVALYVAGRRLEKRVDYSTEVIPFARAINAFPASSVYQANLVEALMEVSKDQGRIEGRRAVVAVANQTSQLSNVTADGVIEQMRRARQAFYAATRIAFDSAGPPTDATSGGRKLALENQVAGLERDRLFSEGTRESGGLHLSTARLAGLPDVLARIAFDLQNQFAVSYIVPAGTRSDGRVTITPVRRGLTIRGPNRLPEI